MANGLLPPDVSGRFRVKDEATWIEGNLGSFLKREIYLYGGYGNQLINEILKRTANTEQRTVLDIGAKVGQHSIKFSAAFGQVHSFEPNPKLWDKFENNVSLNQTDKVTLHKSGLPTKTLKFRSTTSKMEMNACDFFPTSSNTTSHSNRPARSKLFEEMTFFESMR